MSTTRQRLATNLTPAFAVLGALVGVVWTLVCIGGFLYYGIKGFGTSTTHNVQMTLFYGVACILNALGHLDKS